MSKNKQNQRLKKKSMKSIHNKKHVCAEIDTETVNATLCLWCLFYQSPLSETPLRPRPMASCIPRCRQNLHNRGFPTSGSGLGQGGIKGVQCKKEQGVGLQIFPAQVCPNAWQKCSNMTKNNHCLTNSNGPFGSSIKCYVNAFKLFSSHFECF